MHFWHTWLFFFGEKQRNCSNSKNEENFENSVEKEMIFLKKLIWKRGRQLCQPKENLSNKGRL